MRKMGWRDGSMVQSTAIPKDPSQTVHVTLAPKDLMLSSYCLGTNTYNTCSHSHIFIYIQVLTLTHSHIDKRNF